MNVYFVVEPTQIVAQDLADAIQAFDPQAQVRLFRRMAEVPAALAGSRPMAVFLHRDITGAPTLQISQALEAAGVPFAFLGGAVETGRPETPVLASPFTEITVAAMLRRLLGQVSDFEDEEV